jgi:protein SCO1/2
MLVHRAVALVLGLLLCGVVLSMWACSPVAPPPARLNGASFEPAIDLPPLAFTRTDGAAFTTADTRGRTSLFFFGYTHCADVCPLTLSELAQVRRGLGSTADRVDMYFVTLDPARDTPERMREYVANFPGVIGLNGSAADLEQAQATFNVVAERMDMGDGSYMLNHTASIFLVSGTSQIALAYPYGTPPSDITADLKTLVR